MRFCTQPSLARTSKDDSDGHVKFLANFRDYQPNSRPSSDLSSSLAPSHSASQSGHPDYSSQGHSSIGSPVNMLLAPPEAHPENDILNEPTETHYRLSLPAAHALTDENQHSYVPSRIDLPPPAPLIDLHLSWKMMNWMEVAPVRRATSRCTRFTKTRNSQRQRIEGQRRRLVIVVGPGLLFACQYCGSTPRNGYRRKRWALDSPSIHQRSAPRLPLLTHTGTGAKDRPVWKPDRFKSRAYG